MKGLTANQKREKQDPKCPHSLSHTHLCDAYWGLGESGVQRGAPQEQEWRGRAHWDASASPGGAVYSARPGLGMERVWGCGVVGSGNDQELPK